MREDQDLYNIWQAFCTLSDAQELLSVAPDRANDLINHAKLHLSAVLEAHQDQHHRLLLTMPMACTLGSDTKEHSS